MKNQEFKEIYSIVINKINTNARRIYIIFFNAYAWFWLYKIIFIKKLTLNKNWEDYLLWFFATIGMYFFFLDHKEDVLFDTQKSKTQSSEE